MYNKGINGLDLEIYGRGEDVGGKSISFSYKLQSHCCIMSQMSWLVS